MKFAYELGTGGPCSGANLLDGRNYHVAQLGVYCSNIDAFNFGDYYFECSGGLVIHGKSQVFTCLWGRNCKGNSCSVDFGASKSMQNFLGWQTPPPASQHPMALLSQKFQSLPHPRSLLEPTRPAFGLGESSCNHRSCVRRTFPLFVLNVLMGLLSSSTLTTRQSVVARTATMYCSVPRRPLKILLDHRTPTSLRAEPSMNARRKTKFPVLKLHIKKTSSSAGPHPIVFGV